MKKFMVKGERCSGTTYLENLIRTNLGLGVTERQGWKHGYLSSSGLDNFTYEPFDDLVVFVFRGVFDWLRSFYLTPHHLEGAKRAHWEDQPTFSSFIRREVKMFDDSNNERMMDLHPFLLERPKNVLELRRWKSEHWLSYGKLGRPAHYLKYEDLVQDPERMVREINDRWVGSDFDFKNCTNYKNEQIEYRPKKYFEISDEDMSYIVENVDWELEARMGYTRPA